MVRSIEGFDALQGMGRKVGQKPTSCFSIRKLGEKGEGDLAFVDAFVIASLLSLNTIFSVNNLKYLSNIQNL